MNPELKNKRFLKDLSSTAANAGEINSGLFEYGTVKQAGLLKFMPKSYLKAYQPKLKEMAEDLYKNLMIRANLLHPPMAHETMEMYSWLCMSKADKILTAQQLKDIKQIVTSKAFLDPIMRLIKGGYQSLQPRSYGLLKITGLYSSLSKKDQLWFEKVIKTIDIDYWTKTLERYLIFAKAGGLKANYF